MSKKTIYVVSLIGVVLLLFAFNGNIVKSKSSSEKAIGVVSVKRIFDESKKNAQYQEEMAAQQKKNLAEIDKAKADYDAELAGLKTIKTGTDEYMARMKEVINKKAEVTAQQELYQQQMTLKQRQWILGMYNDIVNITKEVAQEKGLDLVLENSEVSIENVPDEDLVMSILIRTAIYTDGCVDLTDEVMSRLDNK